MEEKNLLAQLKEIAKDEDFMAELFESSNQKEFASNLAAKGLELTEEEAKQLYDAVKNGNYGELPEETLDNVSGGVAWGVVWACAFFGSMAYRYFKTKC